MDPYNQNSWNQEQNDPNAGYYPYSPYNKPQKKKHTGLLIFLAVLALLTGAASWAVNVLGVSVDIGQNGLMFAIGDIANQTTELQQTQPTIPEETPDSPIQSTFPVVHEPSDDRLALQDSPLGVENRPSDAEGALSLQEIYDKSIPSVASITCITSHASSSGTGIVMSADGYIITNYHVIEDAQIIYVLLENDQSYEAALVGGDEATDLAVLKIEATDLIPAEFGDSDQLRVGDTVVAIGDPLGSELRGTMTDGIVSAINRDLNLNGRSMTLIQTNAALNSGNSGGPLINCYGQVIGINTMKMSNYSSTSATVEGLGFAIPITMAEPILEELVEQGYVSGRPAIGITGQSISQHAYWFYHMPLGVAVTDVVEGSDAAEKGLEKDDIIVGFNDVSINSLDDLVAAKGECVAGDTVTLTIYRQGRYYQVEIVLMDQISPNIY